MKLPRPDLALACLVAIGLVAASSQHALGHPLAHHVMAQPPRRPKQIFAHYMGSYPVAAGPTAYHRDHDPTAMRHDGNDQLDSAGDRWRNWPLVPEGMHLTLKQSVDLDMRRAMRIGVDGFTIDAWAGGQGAKDVLDAMFEVAEGKKYPFKITVTMDNELGDAVRYLLDKHGNSPNLARRDGKPLIFGYLSIFQSRPVAKELLVKRPKAQSRAAAELAARRPDLAGFRGMEETSPLLNQTPTGWRLQAEAYKQRLQAGSKVPLYMEYCIGSFFARADDNQFKPEDYLAVASVMASEFPAVGSFLTLDGLPRNDPLNLRIAKKVKAHGSEWVQPCFIQYENLFFGGTTCENGTTVLRDNWRLIRETDTSLIQFVTWNDYTENTQLAPAYDTRYAMYDLTGYFIKWWKTGRQPVPDHDRIYLTYKKYPKGAKMFPFKRKQPDTDGVIEVLTILPKPGRIRLPGRNAEFDAPAGLHVREFPLVPGPVSAELLRDGHVVLRLDSPEPITDRPFRQQNGMVCFSSEFMRNWRADFGDAEPYLHGEYADVNHNGLPNWFEMYWYGKFLDYSTATCSDPDADPYHTGKTNLQHYLEQSDPTGGARAKGAATNGH